MSLWILDTDHVSLLLGRHPQVSRRYQQLLIEIPSLSKKRLQKDMRIAAIALSIEAIVVTRNDQDFSQVPGLLLEDWTQER